MANVQNNNVSPLPKFKCDEVVFFKLDVKGSAVAIGTVRASKMVPSRGGFLYTLDVARDVWRMGVVFAWEWEIMSPFAPEARVYGRNDEPAFAVNAQGNIAKRNIPAPVHTAHLHAHNHDNVKTTAAPEGEQPKPKAVQIKIEIEIRRPIDKADLAEAFCKAFSLDALANRFDRVLKEALKAQKLHSERKHFSVSARGAGKSMLASILIDDPLLRVLREQHRRAAEKKQLAALFEANLENAKRRGRIIDYTFSPETGKFTCKPVPPLESLDLVWFGFDPASKELCSKFVPFSPVYSTCPESITITAPSKYASASSRKFRAMARRVRQETVLKAIAESNAKIEKSFNRDPVEVGSSSPCPVVPCSSLDENTLEVSAFVRDLQSAVAQLSNELAAEKQSLRDLREGLLDWSVKLKDWTVAEFEVQSQAHQALLEGLRSCLRRYEAEFLQKASDMPLALRPSEVEAIQSPVLTQVSEPVRFAYGRPKKFRKQAKRITNLEKEVRHLKACRS